MSLKLKRLGPDFFLNILYRNRSPKDHMEQLHQDLTKAFHYLANDSEIPVPYNYEFIRCITEDSGSRIREIEKKFGSIISAPQDLVIWKKFYTDKLRQNYRRWLELKSQRYVFSYFAVAQSHAAFVGILQAGIEKDLKNVPNNHITGSEHPPYVRQTVSQSFRLVKYYLISSLKIPPKEVHEALRTVVIHWEESLLALFSDLFGSSFSFLFTSLFFTCALRNLLENGIISVIDKNTQRAVKPVDIQLPHNVAMSGSFHYDRIPNEVTWGDSYQAVTTKEITSVPAKVEAALAVNFIAPIFEKFILPLGVAYDNEAILQSELKYRGLTYGNKPLLLIPVKNMGELLNALSPFHIEVQKKSFPGIEQKDLSNAQLAGKNLRGVSMPGVDLTSANLATTDLRGADLTGANFTGANLREADLTGANLRGANFQWSDLTKTCLKDADLRGANFREANFNWTNLKEADLRGSNFKNTCLNNVNLERANLTGSELRQVDFKMANLTGAELRGTEFRQAAFEKVNMVNTCLTQVDFTEANLKDANLTGTDLTGANLQRVNLARANCTHTNLERSDLTNANLKGANLTGANLVQATLAGTSLEGADLTEANLTGCNLSGANLWSADFTEANLTGVNFQGANLIDADLTKTDLQGADLSETKITGVFLLSSNLKGARISLKSREYLEKMATKEPIGLDDVIWV